jgi:Ni,Fe-hydrogenase I large subunit
VSQVTPHATINVPGYTVAALPGIGVSAAQLNAALGGPLAPTYNIGISIIDRHRARCLEAIKIIQRILGTDGLGAGWLTQASALAGGSAPGNAIVGSKSLPAQGAPGYGLNEAPRGALGHWLKMGSAGRVSNYQCVVPTTWNGSPRAAHAGVDARGPIEEALCVPALPLSGRTSPVDLAPGSEYVPVEGLRVIHSFDPCIACAVHVIDAKGKKLTKIS